VDDQKVSAEAMNTEELRELTNQQSEQIQRLKDSEQSLLKRQEDLLFWIRQFLAGFPFGLIMVEKDQRIKAINKIACEYFQYTDLEVLKQPIAVLLPQINCLEATKRQTRLFGRKKSGEVFSAEVYINSLEMFGEDLLFITVQDITERQRLEQLRHDLVAMVSHDIRAPLTSVRVTLEMVAEGTYGKLSNRGSELVSQGVHSIEYLNSLVKNLLESEAAETGAIELDYKTTSIGTLIKHAINAVQPPGDASLVSIETEFTNDAIIVDENRIIQVLINLISNAVKFSPEHSKVNVLAGMVGVEAKFEVIDRGPGIPLHQQPLVFERFKQLNQPTTLKRTGFGLGLAICKALVEKHHGRIWVESRDGQGSKFCFTVPIAPAN